jgi:L-threonylcarbamoyladenylate synthase
MSVLISHLNLAADLIQQGQVVAFPTETVYGLGADATNYDACAKIYELKKRPAYNPLIVHVHNLKQAMELGDFSDYAITLAEKFWPGPLTIVVKAKSDNKIAYNVTAGLDTIAIRIPRNEIALALIRNAQTPIAAPSANTSNYITATMAIHVLHDFIDTELHVLSSLINDHIGIESTIVDCSGSAPTILRYGSILAQNIASVTGLDVEKSSNLTIMAPGMLGKHYSPRARLRLNAKSVKINEVGIDFNLQIKTRYSLSPSGNLVEAAKNLYQVLREVDNYAIKNNFAGIAIAAIPNEGLGIAINDKLIRAAK